MSKCIVFGEPEAEELERDAKSRECRTHGHQAALRGLAFAIFALRASEEVHHRTHVWQLYRRSVDGQDAMPVPGHFVLESLLVGGAETIPEPLPETQG